MFIDSFSSSIAELKPNERTPENALRCLKEDPRVSTFDMSELQWLRNLISNLEASGKVESSGGAYPWHNYRIIEKE